MLDIFESGLQIHHIDSDINEFLSNNPFVEPYVMGLLNGAALHQHDLRDDNMAHDEIEVIFNRTLIKNRTELRNGIDSNKSISKSKSIKDKEIK